MDDARVVRGIFADYKPMRGKRTFQIIIEFPLEEAAHVQEVLGQPYGFTTEVAVALLNKKAIPPKEKEPQRWDEMTPPRQAAILCNDPVFAAFIRESFSVPVADKEDAAAFVRLRCGVSSRSDIRPDNSAWTDLLHSWYAWKARENY